MIFLASRSGMKGQPGWVPSCQVSQLCTKEVLLRYSYFNSHLRRFHLQDHSDGQRPGSFRLPSEHQCEQVVLNQTSELRACYLLHSDGEKAGKNPSPDTRTIRRGGSLVSQRLPVLKLGWMNPAFYTII